jgi:hypothetical protein
MATKKPEQLDRVDHLEEQLNNDVIITCVNEKPEEVGRLRNAYQIIQTNGIYAIDILVND